MQLWTDIHFVTLQKLIENDATATACRTQSASSFWDRQCPCRFLGVLRIFMVFSLISHFGSQRQPNSMKCNKLVSVSKNVLVSDPLCHPRPLPPMGVVCGITARNILTQLGGGGGSSLGCSVCSSELKDYVYTPIRQISNFAANIKEEKILVCN